MVLYSAKQTVGWKQMLAHEHVKACVEKCHAFNRTVLPSELRIIMCCDALDHINFLPPCVGDLSAVNVRKKSGRPQASTIVMRSFSCRRCHDGDPGIVDGML